MELDRDAVVGTAMVEARSNGALLVTPLADVDPRGLATKRAPPVRRHDETRCDAAPVGAIEPDALILYRDALDSRGDDRAEHLTCPRIKRLDESRIGDVVAEGGKAEFARPKFDVGGADQAPRGIDDADGFERSRLRGETVEDLERLQEFD